MKNDRCGATGITFSDAQKQFDSALRDCFDCDEISEELFILVLDILQNELKQTIKDIRDE